MLGSLGLADLESPEEALFTSFEDPYIVDTYGTFGDEVPDAGMQGGCLGLAAKRVARGVPN